MRQQSYFVSKRQMLATLIASAVTAGLIATGGCSSSDGGSSSALGNVGGSGNTTGQIGIPVKVTPLVSDRKNQGARNVDPNLVNPWGLAINPDAVRGPLFWTADNGTGLATIYNAAGTPQSLVVTIPPARGQPGPSAPTGQVWNNVVTSFDGDVFIFASEDGVISGWKPTAGVDAVVRADRSQSGALYKGLAIVPAISPDLLLATNFRKGTVDMFDRKYRPISVSGAFVDPQLPAGFAPFNVASFGGGTLSAFTDGPRAVRLELDGYPDTRACHGNMIVGWHVAAGREAGAENARSDILEAPWRGGARLVHRVTF